jgi:hypothetical protein
MDPSQQSQETTINVIKVLAAIAKFINHTFDKYDRDIENS